MHSMHSILFYSVLRYVFLFNNISYTILFHSSSILWIASCKRRYTNNHTTWHIIYSIQWVVDGLGISCRTANWKVQGSNFKIPDRSDIWDFCSNCTPLAKFQNCNKIAKLHSNCNTPILQWVQWPYTFSGKMRRWGKGLLANRPHMPRLRKWSRYQFTLMQGQCLECMFNKRTLSSPFITFQLYRSRIS